MGWFSAAEAQALGKSLATFYIERVPFESPFSKKKFAVKTQDTLKKMTTQINQYKADPLAELLSEGQAGQCVQVVFAGCCYDNAYVDELTEWLMLVL